MKQSILLLSFFFISGGAFGQDSVPVPYHKIREVLGDLDRDGIAEKIVVYNKSDEDEANGVDREVIIFKSSGKGWNIWQRSSTAVGNSRGGGMMGDPFEDIEVKNGILFISQSGGSSWKWSHVDKYRFQNKQLELIGYSSFYGKLCEYWTSVDYNLSTGKVEYKKEYEKCEDESSEVYKKEEESFTHRLSSKVTFQSRKRSELKIITPKFKDEFYL